MRAPPNQPSDKDTLLFEGRPRMLARALYTPGFGYPDRGMRFAPGDDATCRFQGRKGRTDRTRARAHQGPCEALQRY